MALEDRQNGMIVRMKSKQERRVYKKRGAAWVADAESQGDISDSYNETMESARARRETVKQGFPGRCKKPFFICRERLEPFTTDRGRCLSDERISMVPRTWQIARVVWCDPSNARILCHGIVTSPHTVTTMNLPGDAPRETIIEKIQLEFWSELQYAEQRQRQREKTIKKLNARKRSNRGYVYIIKAASSYKIGKSKQPQKRIASLATASPVNLETICLLPTDDCAELEKLLHQEFLEKRIRGEWFALDEDDVDFIRSLQKSE